MEKKAIGTVVSATKQWWLKINTKPVRGFGSNGAIYPYVIKVTYSADGNQYEKRKWIKAGQPVPLVGSSMEVMYSSENPSKARIVY